MSGWIKLHRSILEWEWYEDKNVFRLFMHLLLRANYQEAKYKGEVIGRGSIAVGYPSLAEQTGLSIQQLRTAVSKLTKTADITVKRTPLFSVITLVNYDKYQSEILQSTEDQQEINGGITGEQQESNSQSTGEQQHLKKVRSKEGKNISSLSGTKEPDAYTEEYEILWNNFPEQKPKGKTGGKKGNKKKSYELFQGLNEAQRSDLTKAVSNYSSFLEEHGDRPSCAFDVFIRSKLPEFLAYVPKKNTDDVKEATRLIWDYCKENGLKRTDQTPEGMLETVSKAMSAGYSHQQIFDAWLNNWIINLSNKPKEDIYRYAPKFENFFKSLSVINVFGNMTDDEVEQEMKKNAVSS